MQQSLEQALDQAESINESAQQRSPESNYSSDREKSFNQKLYDIYVEECEKEPEEIQELKSNVNLLEKLVKRESLPCLIVNLYPGKEGYSLMLKENNGSCSESIHLPYEEAELFKYFDAEELPPILVDLLDKSKINVFHSGCVIAEIRDYRQASDVTLPGYHSRHILLRPAVQTLACDVQSIASDNPEWCQEGKLLFESQMLLATAEPLCLDPSVGAACTENRLLDKQKMNTCPVKGNLKRYSASSLNTQQELSGCSPPPELSMVSSCKRSKGSREVPQYDLRISEGSYVDMWKQTPCDLAVPSEVDVEKYCKGKKPVTYSLPVVLPAQVVKDGSGFGCKAGIQSQIVEPIFMQSPSNPPVSGQRSCTEARCERQLSPAQSSTDDHSQSIMPESNTDTGSLVSPSEELVQKDTICPASISSTGSANLSLLSQGEKTFQAETMLIPSSILGQEIEYMDVSMTLPSSSEDSSSWNIFTPEQTISFFRSLSPDPASKPPATTQTLSVEGNSVHMTPTAALSISSTTSSQTSQTLTTVVPNVSVLSTDNFSQQAPALSTTNFLQMSPVLSTDVTQRTLASSTFNLPQRTAVLSSTNLPKTIAPSTVNSSGQTLALSPLTSQITVALSPAMPQIATTLSTVITSQWTSTLPTISSSWENSAVPNVNSSQQISSLSTAIATQYASSLSSVISQKTSAIYTVSSQPTLTLPTVCSTQRALLLPTVDSQRNLDLSTVFSSQRIPILATIDSSQRAPSSYTVVSTQTTTSLSTFSSSLRTVVLPTVHSSQRHLLLSTFGSTQTTSTLSTASSFQRTVVLPTINSIQRTLVTSSNRSSQRIPALTTISSSQRNLSNQAISNSVDLSIRPVSLCHQTQSLVSDSNRMPGSTSMVRAPVRIVNNNALVHDPNPKPGSTSVDRAPTKVTASNKALVSAPNPMPGSTSVGKAPARIVVSYKALVSDRNSIPGSTSVDTAPTRTMVSNKSLVSAPNPTPGSSLVDRAPIRIVVNSKTLMSAPNCMPNSTSVGRAPARITVSNKASVGAPSPVPHSTSVDRAPVRIVVNKVLVSDPNSVPDSNSVGRDPARIVVNKALVSAPSPMPGSTSVDTTARIVARNKDLGSEPPKELPSTQQAGDQLYLKCASESLKPVTLIHVPQDSLLWKIHQQPRQPQHLQHFCQLVPCKQLPKHSTVHPHPLVVQGPNGQECTSQKISSSAQKATSVNLTEVRDLPHHPVLSQLGPLQRRPGQGLPQHRVHVISVKQRQQHQYLPQQQEPVQQQVPPLSTATTTTTEVDPTAENLAAPSNQSNVTTPDC